MSLRGYSKNDVADPLEYEAPVVELSLPNQPFVPFYYGRVYYGRHSDVYFMKSRELLIGRLRG